MGPVMTLLWTLLAFYVSAITGIDSVIDILVSKSVQRALCSCVSCCVSPCIGPLSSGRIPYRFEEERG